MEKAKPCFLVLAIPSGCLHLDDLIGLAIGDDALLDVIRVDQILPSLVIEVEDGLMFFDSLSLDGFRIASLRCIYSRRSEVFHRNFDWYDSRSVGRLLLSLPIPTDPSLIKKLT